MGFSDSFKDFKWVLVVSFEASVDCKRGSTGSKQDSSGASMGSYRVSGSCGVLTTQNGLIDLLTRNQVVLQQVGAFQGSLSNLWLLMRSPKRFL